MKKLKTLFKTSPIVAGIVSLLVVATVSAAILGVYVTSTGTATVEQSVVFGDNSISKTYTFNAMAGNTYTQSYVLKNRSETTAPIKFTTTQCVEGSGDCDTQGNDEEGVDTTYWSEVILDNKDTSTWVAIADAMQAKLTYQLADMKFNYELEASGLAVDTDYSLVYYADRQDRFVNWGGDNPGKLLAEVTADGSGEVNTVGSVNLNMDLPHADDWNGTLEADYCDNGTDNYDLCRGAKVWLIPSSEYDEGTKTVSWGDPTTYLFETDLITYDDTTAYGEALNLGFGQIPFFIRNEFAINVMPGNYTIKSEVQPVQ